MKNLQKLADQFRKEKNAEIAEAAVAIYKISSRFGTEIADTIAEEVRVSFSAYCARNREENEETWIVYEEAYNWYESNLRYFIREYAYDAIVAYREKTECE